MFVSAKFSNPPAPSPTCPTGKVISSLPNGAAIITAAVAAFANPINQIPTTFIIINRTLMAISAPGCCCCCHYSAICLPACFFIHHSTPSHQASHFSIFIHLVISIHHTGQCICVCPLLTHTLEPQFSLSPLRAHLLIKCPFRKPICMLLINRSLMFDWRVRGKGVKLLGSIPQRTPGY